MKKNAYTDTTIKATGKRLRHLERNCNLENPEQVKVFIARKLQIPSIAQIRLYDFRHYFASVLYHKTKDLLFVKIVLDQT